VQNGDSQSRKKRVLLVGEFCLNRTGYSVMSFNILDRLYKLNKYEVAEMAIYCKVDDPRVNYVPWKVYPIIPADNDELGQAQFNSRGDAKFGGAAFEDTCLKFKPDIVIDFRDVQWMATFQLMSPFREYYSLLWMPTIDASPQIDEWLNQYVMADSLLTYTFFGKEVLDKSCGKTANILGVASPGINIEEMKPLNKPEIREKYGLPADIKLVGMVARNQLRKLYPDLFAMFRKFLEIAPKDLAEKTFLHIHTGYPDQGWDIPRLLKEHGISHKVYFTYICGACGKIKISKWNDYLLPCDRCFNRSVIFTSPAYGVNREKLCEIYNLYDFYIQYAALEGFGVPVVEAAACGIPLAVVPYSGTEDFVKLLNAHPIPIAKYVSENQTHRVWAYPDNDLFALQLVSILQTPLARFGKETRELCVKTYDWDKIAKIWENAIDNTKLPSRKWNEPRREFKEIIPSQNSTNDEFVRGCFKDVAFLPALEKGFLYYKFVKDLYNGYVPSGDGNTPFNRDNILQQCKSLQQATIHWENIRCQQSST
jgi:glycosyltransferase involved in cell wall biosynthesis